jgi:predicted phosphodiesterase
MIRRMSHGRMRAPGAGVAVLWDVHGNLPALESVLAEVDELGVDAIVVGGDVASGPMPVETLEAPRELNALFVRGNADRVLDLVGANTGETWSIEKAPLPGLFP